MRPGQQNKRGRGRGNNNSSGGSGGGGGNNNFNRKGGNPLSRTYDSSGPDVKIRGTAQHIAEKYSTLARDAQSSGDRVMAENYLQHAEHYNRIIAAAQAQMQDRFPRDERGEMQDRDGNVLDQDDLDGSDGDDMGYGPQPVMDEQPRREQSGHGQNTQQGGRQGQNAQHGQNPQQSQNPQQGQGGQPAPAAEGAEQPPRENRRDPRRERRQDRPERVAQQPAEISAPVADPDGPQPVIEGTPAEVAVEEEAQAEAAPRRRRNAGNRPRRPRRGEAGAGEGEASGDDQPTLVDVAGE